MSEPRVATHNLSADSGVVHAAGDASTGPLWHILACTGRAVRGGGWPADEQAVSCKSCLKALATGKAVWK